MLSSKERMASVSPPKPTKPYFIKHVILTVWTFGGPSVLLLWCIFGSRSAPLQEIVIAMQNFVSCVRLLQEACVVFEEFCCRLHKGCCFFLFQEVIVVAVVGVARSNDSLCSHPERAVAPEDASVNSKPWPAELEVTPSATQHAL